MNTLENQPNCSTSALVKQNFRAPRINITEAKDRYVLTADLPGVDKAGVEITLEGQELTLVGRRQTPRPAPEAGTLYREIRREDFRRAFILDPVIDTAKIQARVENGVLTLTLPKREQPQPSRIAITD